jgi:hypothetical protein
MLPSLSLALTTLAPSCVAFSIAYWATLPLPLTGTVLPLKLSLLRSSFPARSTRKP